MKLYLSSDKIGNKPDELIKWRDTHDNKIALIINARDHFPIDKEKLLVYKMI